MTATQWAEFAGLGFALAVLAWVIWRLTGTLSDLILKRRTPDTEQEEDG